MTPRLMIMQCILALIAVASSLAVMSALAQGQPAQPPATEIVTPRPAATQLAWPTPPPEIASRYPVIDDPSLLRYPDGRVVLSVPRRNKATREADELYAVWLFELDGTGAAVEHRVVPFTIAELPARVLPTRDGGVFIHSGAGWNRGLLRADRDGNTLWHRSLPGEVFSGTSIGIAAEMHDGGFLIVGARRTGIDRNTVGVLVRLDAAGRQLWHRQLGPRRGSSSLGDIAPLPDGTAIVAGGLRFYRLNSAGGVVWQRELASVRYMVPSRDGSVIAAGQWSADYDTGGPARLRVARLDRNGRELWRRDPLVVDARAYKGSLEAVFPAPDGGALLYLTQTYDRPAREPPACRDAAQPSWTEHLLLRIDDAGILHWARDVSSGLDQPCGESNRPHALDATVLASGRVLILGAAIGQRNHYQDGELWLRTVPFD